jgi:hypothetical protein
MSGGMGITRRRAMAALAVLVAGASVAHAQDPRASLVQDAARDWLAIVDRGEYAKSLEAAGARLRNATNAERWANAVAPVRSALGPLKRRTVYRTSFTEQFPGAPKGAYATVLFRSDFERRSDVGEQLTLEREADGRWRVIGYVIE